MSSDICCPSNSRACVQEYVHLRLQQQCDRGHISCSCRDVQWSQAPLISLVDCVWGGLTQSLHSGCVMVLYCQVQGRLITVIDMKWVCALQEKKAKWLLWHV